MQIVSTITPLRDDSDQNFYCLAEEFLQAARFTNQGFKKPVWPTYYLIFQSLEHFLKGYVLAHDPKANEEYVRKVIGHSIRKGIKEAKKDKLALNVPPEAEATVLGVSDYYARKDFQYREFGEWNDLLTPDDLLRFVEVVRKAVDRH